jgi:cytochrome oxidase Cu insertion factor (SCO1/SenC/PrrC family)
VLLYFGLRVVPGVCPTDLAAMGELVKTLGAQGDACAAQIYVTLDPQT